MTVVGAERKTWRDAARSALERRVDYQRRTESTKSSAMAVYAAGSKSCICHGAMGGVAHGRRVPKAHRGRPRGARFADAAADVSGRRESAIGPLAPRRETRLAAAK